MCPPSPWIPAFAGTTGTTVDFPATDSELLGVEPRGIQ